MTRPRQDPRREPHDRDDDDRDSPGRHRVDVVRRLLDHGMSTRSIAAVLPGWEREIAEARAERRSAERRDSGARG